MGVIRGGRCTRANIMVSSETMDIIRPWHSKQPSSFHCRFRIDNTDHIIDVSVGDRVDFICPLYHLDDGKVEFPETFIIYAVDKEDYDSCRIMDQHPRAIAKCDSPRERKFFTVSFRSFSPSPGALEFKPGNDYHFISTSSKMDLHNRVGGRCRDNNMKLVFKVADPSKTTTTTTTTTTTESALESRDHSLSNVNTIDDKINSNNKKKENKRRRRKKRKNKKHNKNKHREEDEEGVVEQAQSDNPMDEEEPPRVMEKELSYVEKVNNLMKQEASLSSTSSASSTSGFLSFSSSNTRGEFWKRGGLSFWISTVLCLVSTWLTTGVRP